VDLLAASGFRARLALTALIPSRYLAGHTTRSQCKRPGHSDPREVAVFTLKNLLLFVPVLVCGCAQGFDRAALRDRLNDGTIQINDTAIAEARATKPQLRFPCRIAVYLKPADRDEWRWTHEDKAAMEPWAAALKQEGIASEVFPLPEMLVGKSGGDVKELRLAAAKCGADVLFVIHGAAQTDSYKNIASVFNLTVVGGYVIPGSHRDSLFMMEGVLLDVDNSYIYTAVQAEGVGKIIRPTFVIEDKDAIKIAKTKAITQFGDEFVKRMRTLAGTPPLVSDVNWKGVKVGATSTDIPAPNLDVPVSQP
jgi:rhombotail lipoprotein